METQFNLKPNQNYEFTEDKVEFKIKNLSNKTKQIKIEIKTKK